MPSSQHPRPVNTIARRATRSLGLIAAIAALSVSASASAATIKVKTDRDDFSTGTSCSLRQAIESANTDAAFGGCTAGSGADTIELQGGHRYIREQAGVSSEDNNATGDYDVKSDINLSVKGNGKAEINGGGLDRVFQIFSGAKLTGSDLTVRDGDTFSGDTTAGGGILDEGSLVLSHSNVIRNETLGTSGCTCGGGISVDGKATLDHVKVNQNKADNIGGGISWLGGKLRVNDSTLAGNTAQYIGGGMYLGSDVGAHNSVQIRNSTISGNHSHAQSGNGGGGGIVVSDFAGAKISATNVTIAGNSAESSGGGVWVYSGSIKLDSATVTDNTANAAGVAVGDGGGLAGSVTATNSIVTGNHDLTSHAKADCLVAAVSSSLVGHNTGCTEAPTNRVSNHPKLGPLESNGGPTKTIALGKHSPAVNHGSKSQPGKDQRGRKRDSKPDLGAYELIA